MHKLLSIIDFFVSERVLGEGGDTLYKSRLLSGIALTYIVVSLIFAIFFGISPGMTMAERMAGVLPVIFITSGFFGVLFLLKNKGAFYFCSHVLVLVTYASIMAGVIMTGGPVLTPSGAFLLLPVFLAFCLLNMTGGFIWTAIVFAVNLVCTLMYFNGYEFPMVTAPDMVEITRAFNWFMAFIAVVSLIVIYEAMNNRLRRERDEERDRYQHVADVASDSLEVSETADALSKVGSDLLDASLQQKTAVEELSATTEQLGATSEQNDALAESAMKAIRETEQSITISTSDILQLVSSMNDVQSSSEQIQTINNVINEIAYQTNLLSLNAMIEASRAGEGNGGFKVVALEVKKLAERSAEAAEGINKLLIENLDSVKKGVDLSETMKDRFSEITEKVDPLAAAIQNVSDASKEQTEAIRQILFGLQEIDRATENNQQLSEKSKEMVISLRENSGRLAEAIAQLKVEK